MNTTPFQGRGLHRLWAPWLALFLGGLMPSTARAADEETKEKAAALFDRGRRHAREGRWGQAAGFFSRSWQMERSAEALYSLGVAQRALGDDVAAHATFVAFLSLDLPAELDPFETAARRALAELERRTSVLHLPYASQLVAIDDEPVALPDGAEVRLAPGTHVVEYRVPEGARESVELPPGERVQLVARRPAHPRDDARPEDEGVTWRPLVGWLAVGVGAGALSAGVTTGLLGVGRARGARIGTPDASAGRRLAVVGDSLAFAGALLGAAGVTVLLWPSEDADATRPPARLEAVAFGTGLGLRGAF